MYTYIYTVVKLSDIASILVSDDLLIHEVLYTQLHYVGFHVAIRIHIDTAWRFHGLAI